MYHIIVTPNISFVNNLIRLTDWNYADHRMWILLNGILNPTFKMIHNETEAGERHGPRKEHEETMELQKRHFCLQKAVDTAKNLFCLKDHRISLGLSKAPRHGINSGLISHIIRRLEFFIQQKISLLLKHSWSWIIFSKYDIFNSLLKNPHAELVSASWLVPLVYFYFFSRY